MKIQEFTDEQKQKLRKNLREAMRVLGEIDRIKQEIANIRNNSNYPATRLKGTIQK